MSKHPLAQQIKGDTEGKSGSWLGNTAKQVGTALVGGPGSIAQGAHNVGAAIGNYFSSEENQMEPLQVQAPTVESLRERFEVPEPEGWAQEIFDNTARTAPLLLLGPGSLSAKVANSLLSSASMTAVKKAGGGPALQFAASLGASKGFDKLQSFFKSGGKPDTLNAFAEVAKKDFYDKEAKLGAKINVPKGKYQVKWDNIIDKIENDSALDLAEKQNLIARMNLYKNDAATGTINAAKLAQRNKQINSLYPKLQGQKNSVARQYMNEAKSIVQDTAKSIGKRHKSWYNNFSSANDIHRAQNYQSDLADMIEESPQLAKQVAKPIIKKILGMPAGIAGAVAGAALEPVKAAGKAIVEKGKEIYGFYQYPAGQKILKEFYGDVAKKNIPRAVETLAKLNTTVDKWEKTNEDKPVGDLHSYSEDKPVGKLRPFIG